jgi:hypothetical protein
MLFREMVSVPSGIAFIKTLCRRSRYKNNRWLLSGAKE